VDVKTGAETVLIEGSAHSSGAAVTSPSGPAHRQASEPQLLSPTLAGEDRYTNGSGTLPVRVRAFDAAVGLSRVAVTLDGATTSDEADCSEGCPEDLEGTLPIDLGELSEGRYAARLAAVNLAGTRTVDRRALIVDRSNPTPPAGVESLEDGDDLLVSWSRGGDPGLTDGSSGAGVRLTKYRYLTDAGWSAWRVASDTSTTIAKAALNSERQVQLASVDRAGNTSVAAQASLCGVVEPCVTAASRSAGARRVARRNRRARNAIKRVLSTLTIVGFKRADAALASFDEAMDWCTDDGRRPPTHGCPGLTADDTKIPLRGVYEAVRGASNALSNFFGNVLDALKELFDREPTAEEKEQWNDFLVDFAFDAAAAAGVVGKESQAAFIRRHAKAIADGAILFAKREVHRNGAFLIARGVSNTRLKNAIIANYRYGAKIGNGSTADALVSEAAKGCVRTACKHYTKAVERRRSFTRDGGILEEGLSMTERKIADDMVRALSQAIEKAGG
jgi:hypothetical protein